jgi:hypothetical protein
MTRLLLVLVALLPLLFASPALAQSSKPTKTPAAKKPAAKKPAKKGKKKVSLTKDSARKLVHSFLVALEKKNYAKAMTMVQLPFSLAADGKVTTMKKAQLEKALKGKFGTRAAKLVKGFRKSAEKEMTALYWGPKSARGKATAKKHKVFQNVGWVGTVYAGKKKKAEEAKKPFAVKLVAGKLLIVGFHDD